MPAPYATPQEAEDAFYDSIEAKDLDAMMAVWAPSDDIACLLPMQALQQGAREVAAGWRALFAAPMAVEITVRHLGWIETGDTAIHLIEEEAQVAGHRPAPPIYATNIYRKGADGWQLVMHWNAPLPPPPGLMQPGQMPPPGMRM